MFAPQVKSEDACTISSDIALYYERAEGAVILAQYEDVVLRATNGQVACREDTENGRQDCRIDGPGELLIESDKGVYVVQLNTEAEHILHVYPGGDLSCGPASDLK